MKTIYRKIIQTSLLSVLLSTVTLQADQPPNNIKQLREAYSKARSQKLTELNKSYLKALEKLKISLTKKGELDEAIEIKNEIAKIQKENESLLRGINPQNQQAQTVKREEPEEPKRKHYIPDDAVKHGDSWYKFYNEDVSWNVAANKCKKMRGRLAIIRDEKTNQFLTGLFNKTTTNNIPAWIGCSEKKGVWTWLDGSKATYTNWDTKDLRYAGDKGETHVCFRLNGRWLQRVEVYGLGFLCEWPEKEKQ